MCWGVLRRRLDFFMLDCVSVKHRDWELEIKKRTLILQTLGRNFNITCSRLQTQEPDWVSPNVLSPAASSSRLPSAQCNLLTKSCLFFSFFFSSPFPPLTWCVQGWEHPSATVCCHVEIHLRLTKFPPLQERYTTPWAL